MTLALSARLQAAVLLVVAALALKPNFVAAETAAATVHAQRASDDAAPFDTLVAEHRAIRAKLGTNDQRTLDKLTARIRDLLVGHPLRKGLWETTTAALKTSGMKVSVRERSVLATYLLDAIAARDDMPDALLHAQSALDLQEAQMSFNLQYLQLQSQMQEENRSYASISAIMKTKHDTVKNSIANVR